MIDYNICKKEKMISLTKSVEELVQIRIVAFLDRNYNDINGKCKRNIPCHWIDWEGNE